MDIFEFELRYLSYQGLVTRFTLPFTTEDILVYVKKTDQGQLTKKVNETSLDELREATRATYTAHKKELIQKYSDTVDPISGKSYGEYIERLEYELKVIHEMHYNTYFLVVQDYINRARDQQIVVGPGRWSCAWSLLSYLIGITDLDPLTYDLIFERFLNPWRISMPDIDSDFEDIQREKVIVYIREKYGNEQVAHIGTYMTMAAKAACKDVARVMWVNFEQSNKLSALVTGKTIEDSIASNDDLKALLASDERIKHVVTLAARLEGTVRQTGVHACGMIIAPEPAVRSTPLQYPPNTNGKTERDETRIVSQYDGPTVENVGLLKMDLLGLRNLSIIKNTIKILNAKAKREGRQLEHMFQEFLETTLFHPPLDDQYTFKKIFHTGDTSWVFQFESDGMKNWLKKLKPTVFDDLIAMVSLYRPWPMEYIPHYVDRKHGIQAVRYADPELVQTLTQTYSEETAKDEQRKLEEDLAPFMTITYGIPVYQEQLMRIVQAMAWFSMAEADNLRKWVGKKIREVIEKIKVEFIQKAGTYRDYKPETAQWIYEKMIEPAADYSFNKSHAACYAYISYQTAYLKAHHPLEFHAALLRSVEEDTEKLAKFIDEIKLQWFEVKLPDVNRSFEHISAVDWAIQLWFLSIKGIWWDIARGIEEERTQHGDFTSLTDFCKRCKQYINKKSVESLIKSWWRDRFGDRYQLLANMQGILDRVKSTGNAATTQWLFDDEDIGQTEITLKQVGVSEDPFQDLRYEFELYKTLISAHPLDGIFSYIKQKNNMANMVRDTENFGEFRILGMVKEISRGMRWGYFLKVEDISGEIEFYMQSSCDLAPMDVIQIKWRKWKSTRIEFIAGFDIMKLREKLKRSGSFSEEGTVSAIRKARYEANALSAPPQTAQTPVTTPDIPTRDQKPSERLDTNSLIDKTTDQTPPNTRDDSEFIKPLKTDRFPLPEDIKTLDHVREIITKHPGDQEVHIWEKPRFVSPTWKELLQKLFNHTT